MIADRDQLSLAVVVDVQLPKRKRKPKAAPAAVVDASPVPRKYMRAAADDNEPTSLQVDDDATEAAFAAGLCCGVPMRTHLEQLTTVGGLAVVGGNACDVCGGRYVGATTREASAATVDSCWTLAAGGRSVNCGGMRLRLDGKSTGDAVVELMARIVRVPQLEAEVARLTARCDQLSAHVSAAIEAANRRATP